MSTKAQERAASAIKIVAAATLSARGATAEQRELAQAVLGATEAAELAGELEAAREAEQLADAFNRQMDAAIDAVDRSRKADDRATRRAYLARSLEGHGLVLIDAGELARMVVTQIDGFYRVTTAPAPSGEMRGGARWPDWEEPESLGAELLDGGDCQDPNVND